MTEKIHCDKHGDQLPAFVCTHVVQSIEDGVARGLVYSIDDEGCVNAYCTACEAMLNDNGGEWTEELEEKADIKMVCQACTRRAFEINNIATGGIESLKPIGGNA
ncbi:MAG: hypothetical protein IPL47_08040 [Phyllobacteriaceae bacterium]|nr:hypothetical protein [Phyllobacteriaceae bacterium]